jgi:D-3-phosphoglycerate dehydrogenase
MTESVPLPTRSEEDIIKTMKGYAAVIAGAAEQYTYSVMSALLPELKAIMRFGVGYDNIDTKAARALGVTAMIAAGGNASAVAEQALTLMLAIARHTCRLDREMRQGKWSPRIATQLEGKTVGIVGFGRIGRILAEYLIGFKCELLVVDDYIDDSIITRYGASRATMDEIAAKSDYISLHAPLSDETRGIIDKAFLNSMKPTAFLINTSRGPVVNEDDLIEALTDNVIAGAGLDVFVNEPLQEVSKLRELDNVILAPHAASGTQEANLLSVKIMLENLSKLFKGEPCDGIVS